MAPTDPFGESGYARIEPSGDIRAMTAAELEQAQRTVAYWPDRDHALDHDHCFLCGSQLTADTRSEEHVFPQWLLRDFDLWQQSITLLNGTWIPYRSLKIPACKECNNFWLSQVEDEVATAFRAGPEAVASLDQTLLVSWLAKIYYGIHFKEIGLPADRRDTGGPRILSAEELRRLRDLHHLLQALRRRVRFTRPLGSLFVFRAQAPDQPSLQFDYSDARNVAYAGVRIGSTAVVASLMDWGATSGGMRMRVVEAARQLDLHPLQFAEVLGVIGYAAAQFVGVFIYFVQQVPDRDVLTPVLVREGDDPDPQVFAPISARRAAEAQAAFMGFPVEDVYDDETGALWSTVAQPDGTPIPMSLQTIPMGTPILTPLRAAREAQR